MSPACTHPNGSIHRLNDGSLIWCAACGALAKPDGGLVSTSRLEAPPPGNSAFLPPSGADCGWCGPLEEGARPAVFNPGPPVVTRHDADHVDVVFEGVRLCYRRKPATPSAPPRRWWLNEMKIVAPGALIDTGWLEKAKVAGMGQLVKALGQDRAAVRAALGDTAPIRCDECNAIVFGRGLDRLVPLRSVECQGGGHRLEWEDGSAADVGPDGTVTAYGPPV